MKRIYYLLIATIISLTGAQQARAWTVYLDVSKGSLSGAPKIYYWGGESNSWPGSPMTKVATGLYKFTSTGSTPTNCIFCTPESTSNSATKLDTNDLTLTDGNVYQWSGTSNTSGTVSVLFNTTDSYSVSDFNVYFDLSAVSSKYSDPYLYIWNLLGDPTLADGTSVSSSNRYKLTSVTGNIYKLALKVPFASADYIKGIVVSGSGSSWDPQTTNITELHNGALYTVSSTNGTGSDSSKYTWVKTSDSYTEPVALSTISKLYFSRYTADDLTELTGTGNTYTYTGKLKKWEGDGATADNNGSYCYTIATLNGDDTNYWYYSKDDYGIHSLDTEFTGSWNYASTKQRIRFTKHTYGHYCTVTITTDETSVTSLKYVETPLDAIASMTLNDETLTASADGKSFTGTLTADAASTALKLKSNPDGDFPYYWTAANTYTYDSSAWTFTTTADASYNVTVTLSDDKTKVTAVSLDEIKSPITSVSLMPFLATGSDYSQVDLKTTDGTTFTGKIILKAYGGTGDKNQYRSLYIATTQEDGETARWGCSTDDYLILKADTEITGWQKSDTYRFRFSDGGGLIHDNPYTITVKLSDDKASVASLTISEYVAPAIAVHMPLTEADFKNADGSKKAHYFLVGTRTADWRLQPEWELTPNADGTEATLSGRLMYNGMFGIARVDNYADYTKHIYDLYANDGYTVYKSWHSGITLKLSQAGATALHYDDASAKAPEQTERLRWIWDADNGGKTALTTNNINNSTAVAYLNSVTLTLTDGVPAKLSFDADDTEATLAKYRTISLVGDKIIYDQKYDFGNDNVKDLEEMTPTKKGGEASGWSNAWIQRDADGQPYVDGNGEVLLCTAYDSNWLSTHTIKFYNSSKDFSYDSRNVTFYPASRYADDPTDEFRELYAMHPRSSTTGNGYDEIGYNGERVLGDYDYIEIADDEINTEDSSAKLREGITSSDWECYVVKDMWVDGNFKLWTGFGGNLKKFDGVDEEGLSLWFYGNGGHGCPSKNKEVKGYDVTAQQDVHVYPTTRDKYAANFSVNDLTYYSRVLFWYNPSQGFDGSVLQLVRPSCGPVIQAFHLNDTDKPNTLKANWWIEVSDTSNDTSRDNYLLTAYSVDRYRMVDGNGVLDEEDIVSATGLTTKLSEVKDSSSPLTFNDDAKPLSAGDYYYVITATIDKGNDVVMTKKATSNVITIYEAACPVSLGLQQQVTDDKKTTFNLQLDLAVKSEYMDRTVGTSTVSDMMNDYIITFDDDTMNQLATNTEVDINGTTYTDYKVITSENEHSLGNTVMKPGTNFLLIDRSLCTGDNMGLTLTWHNVVPNRGETAALKANSGDAPKAYAFKVYLLSSADNIDAWAEANFQPAVAGIDIVAPSATLTLDGIALSKSDKANTAIDAADTASQPDGALLKKVSDGAIVDGSYEIACPVAYSDLNQFVAKATLTLPALAQEVLDNTDVTYSVAVLKQGTDLAHGTNDFTLTTTSSPAELTMTVPVDKNGLSGLYNAYVNVNYAATGKYDLTNTDDRASKGVEQEIALDAPTFTLSDSGYAKYEDHNWDGVTYSSLGYFSHVGLQFDITSNGFDYSTVNSYVSFDIPQNACTVDGEGCYATNSTDTNGNPMWKHSFAGTRAANGGAPLCFDYSDAIKAIANDGVTYKEYDSSLLTAGQTWADIYDAANNWSLLAARSGRLSVMVNPAYSYADATAYAAGQMSGSLSASLGLIIPVDETPSISIAGTASSKAAGKVLRKAAATTGISSLTSASAEPMTIDLQNVAVVTGISEVEADAATTGDTVYYNLQGIRVEHPAAGQIYIVRRGTTASKCIMK